MFTKERSFLEREPQVLERLLPARRGYLRWLNGPLWRALRLVRPDVFLATNYILPVLSAPKSVLFVHDISVVSHPEWYPRKYSLSRKFLIRRSLERAAAVVVPSEFTRNEILKTFGCGVEKVRVIPYGIEDAFKRAQEERIREWKKEKRIEGGPVVGFLGSFFKRRHLSVLIRTAGRLREELPGLVLFLVGKNYGAFGKREEDRIGRLGWIRWEHSLPEKDLPLFYSALDVFAYLSEYEGFGFPPLEALACGTPAVVLNRTSLSEILSGLAVMVENPNEEEVGRALRQALTDLNLKSRLIGQFSARRDEFSWDRSARGLAVLINELR